MPREQELRQVLESARLEATNQITSLTRDFEGMLAASEASNADDEHDPEGATIAFERAQVAALLTQSRARLADVDGALERLADGAYGGCERCGQSISAERLIARPSARTCITCATLPRRQRSS